MLHLHYLLALLSVLREHVVRVARNPLQDPFPHILHCESERHFPQSMIYTDLLPTTLGIVSAIKARAGDRSRLLLTFEVRNPC